MPVLLMTIYVHGNTSFKCVHIAAVIMNRVVVNHERPFTPRSEGHFSFTQILFHFIVFYIHNKMTENLLLIV